MYTRLNDTNSLVHNEKLLENSQQQKTENKTVKTRHGCYSNKKVQKQTKLDRNENKFGSRSSTANNALNRNTFVNITNTFSRLILLKKTVLNTEVMESGKTKKIVRIEDCRTQEDGDKMTEEEVTEMTFHILQNQEGNAGQIGIR